LDPSAVARLDGGVAGVAMVEAENSFNWESGAVYPLERLRAVREAATRLGVPMHLDGARLWNASAASGVPLADYAACADTVMVCYSKGLGAPVGSAICGTAAFAREARDARKMMGGGMRQVGVLAAGALHGLRHHRERLREDHARARRFAEAVAEIPPFRVNPEEIETNIVIPKAEREPEKVGAFVAAARRRGVLFLEFGGPGAFRAITHLDVDDAGLDRAIAAAREAAAEVWGPQ
jgi:threonine aldolase